MTLESQNINDFLVLMSKQPSRHRSLSPASCWGNCQRLCAPAEMFTHSPLLTACQEFVASSLFCSLPDTTPGKCHWPGMWGRSNFLEGSAGPVLRDTPRQKVLTSVLLWRGAGGRMVPALLGLCLGSQSWKLPLVPSRQRPEAIRGKLGGGGPGFGQRPGRRAL